MNKLTYLLNIILKFLTRIKIIESGLPPMANLFRLVYFFITIIFVFYLIKANMVEGWLGWNNFGIILPLGLLFVMFKLYIHINKSGLLNKLIIKLISLFKK
tara:strand:- start:73 stop:375 length:303 start_codon:yes stop_codon:yes gene_type:complete